MKNIKTSASDKLKGNLAMLCVAILFGINFPATKYLLAEGYMDPFALMFVRMAFGTVAFWITSLFFESEMIEKKDIVWLLLSATLGILINQGSFIIGMQYTSPIDGSILVTTLPIITMITSYFYIKEPISLKKLPGVIIGGVGAIGLILFTQTEHSGEGSSLLGNLIIMIGVVSYSSFFVLGRRVSTKYGPITIMKWMFLFSSLVLMPFVSDNLAQSPIWEREFSWGSFASLAFVLLGATFLPYLLLPIAQRRIAATTMSMYNYIIPVVATTSGILMGSGELTFANMACAAMIFVGVFFVVRAK